MAPFSLGWRQPEYAEPDTDACSSSLSPTNPCWRSAPSDRQVGVTCFPGSDLSSATEGSRTVDLKPPISKETVTTWSSLPVDVKFCILDKLNYLDLYRAKRQSKEFKSLIESEEFRNWRRKVREGLLTALHFFVRKGVWYCEGYDLITTSWRPLPPFTALPDLDPDTFKDHTVCAADGLICADVGRGQDHLIVFNPLTGASRELPPLHHRRSPVLVHMIVYPNERYYMLIVAGSSGRKEEHLSKITEVYDSRAQCWTVTGELPGPLFALNEHQAGVYVNGLVLCIAFLDNDRGKGILAYSVADERWLPERAVPLPYTKPSNIVQLTQNDDEAYLFSEIEQDRRIEHRIDVLDQTERQWRSVMTETKVGSPALQTYHEYTGAPFGPGKLCVYNTIEHHGIAYEVQSGRRCDVLAPPPRPACGELAFFTLNPVTFAFAPTFKVVEP